MIKVTGLDLHGQPQDCALSALLDDGFDQAVLRGMALRPKRLIGMLGPVEVYSARPSEEQLSGAQTLASRWLRLECRAHQNSGGMRLGGKFWSRISRVDLDEHAALQIRRDAALAQEHDDTEDTEWSS